MATVASTSQNDYGFGARDISFTNIPSGDNTENIATRAFGPTLLVASVAMSIQVPNGDETVWRDIPAGQTVFINPTGSAFGLIAEAMRPVRFRVLNNSGSAGSLTIYLLPPGK